MCCIQQEVVQCSRVMRGSSQVFVCNLIAYLSSLNHSETLESYTSHGYSYCTRQKLCTQLYMYCHLMICMVTIYGLNELIVGHYSVHSKWVTKYEYCYLCTPDTLQIWSSNIQKFIHKLTPSVHATHSDIFSLLNICCCYTLPYPLLLVFVW